MTTLILFLLLVCCVTTWQCGRFWRRTKRAEAHAKIQHFLLGQSRAISSSLSEENKRLMGCLDEAVQVLAKFRNEQLRHRDPLHDARAVRESHLAEVARMEMEKMRGELISRTDVAAVSKAYAEACATGAVDVIAPEVIVSIKRCLDETDGVLIPPGSRQAEILGRPAAVGCL